MRNAVVVSLFALITHALPAAAAAAAPVDHFEVTRDGVTVRATVVPAGATLAHTTQLLDTDTTADAGGSVAAAQAGRVLDGLDALLDGVGGSLETLARVNLYAVSPEAAADARRVLDGRVKCAVSTVVTSLPANAALVAMDAVAVAAPDAKVEDPASLRLLASDRAVYISGMAADAKDMAEATRLTLEQLDAVLRHLGLERTDVVQVKSFIRGGGEHVPAARGEVVRFFEDKSPPMTWVEWTMPGPIEIEMIAQGKPAAAGGASAKAPAQDTVAYLTPPGAKASPVYSRVATVHGGRTIYTSGVASAAPPAPEAAAETRRTLAALREVVKKAGGDFEHLVKATYYPATDDTSKALNQVRPEFYNPARPPAASKAPARGTGTANVALTMDLIAITPPTTTTTATAAKPQAAAAPADEPGKHVSLEEFEAKMKDKDVVILDVRTPEEFAAGHVPGATNVNVTEPSFADRAAALDKSKTYLVYCRSGRRSTNASAIMKDLGFTRVYNYAGSMNEWTARQKPVEKGAAKP